MNGVFRPGSVYGSTCSGRWERQCISYFCSPLTLSPNHSWIISPNRIAKTVDRIGLSRTVVHGAVLGAIVSGNGPLDTARLHNSLLLSTSHSATGGKVDFAI